MTLSQANRLRRYSEALGLRAEVHTQTPKGKTWRNTQPTILRLASPGGGWFWCYHHSEWPRYIRYIRSRYTVGAPA